MRLFTGIAPAARNADLLEAALAPLRAAIPLHWSPRENLHITTKFVGEWPEARLPELTQALAAMERVGPFPVEISRFGFFPNPHRPRFFFAGVQAGPPLAELARRTDTALEPLRCRIEDRAYTPHLTLARIGDADHPENLPLLREALAAVTNFNFGSFMAESFHLFLSRPGRNASVYFPLADFPL